MKHISEFIDEAMREDFEERDGIIQFEANQTRDEAERAAMSEIRRKVDSDKVAK